MGGSTSRPFPHHLTTASEVIAAFPDAARGKTVLVTGARTGGLGWETARALAAGGASVVLACRSQALCDEGIYALRASVGAEAASRASALVVDLGSVASCKAAGASFVARGVPLHVLVNNAGIMASPMDAKTKDGLEAQFGTNHIGHFALTQALMPALVAGAAGGPDSPRPGARVVNVSSVGHWIFSPNGGILFDDIRGGGGKAANPWSRYASSKLANVLHAAELNRRFAGEGVVGVSLHPGNIMATRLGENMLGSLGTFLTMTTYLFPLIAPIVDPLKSIEAGAATSVFCAIAPLESAGGGVRPGAYHQDCAIAKVRVNPLGSDEALAARLFEASEKLVAELSP